MSTSRAKRRRVSKTSHSEEVIDLVSSSDNSPELVSSTGNLWYATSPPSTSSCPTREQNRRIVSRLDGNFAETVGNARPRVYRNSLPSSRPSNLRQGREDECLESSSWRSRNVTIHAEILPHSRRNERNEERTGNWRLQGHGESSSRSEEGMDIGNLVHFDSDSVREERTSVHHHSGDVGLEENCLPRYQRSTSYLQQFSNGNVGETAEAGSTSSSGIRTRSGRSYAARTTMNPRMNIQRRILEAERRSMNRESNHRHTSSSWRQTTPTRRTRVLSGSSSSSRSISRSLSAWIEYFRQVNPWLLLSFHEGDFTADDYQMLLQLDERVENKRGASKSIIDSIPCVEVTESENGETCCICLDEYELGETLKKLPCNHVFHKTCIEQWLMENACCPIDKERMDGDKWEQILK